MVSDEDIRQGFKSLVKPNAQSILCKIVDVDKNARTCTVEDDGVEYYEIALQSIPLATGGILTIPQIGSAVVIFRVEESDNWTLVKMSAIDEVVINDGTNGGLINIDEMLKWMKSVKTDMNAIQGAITALQGVFVSTTEIPNRALLEDTKIKH